MKNIELWNANKFVLKKGKLIASRNPKEVSISSRLGADLVAECYQNNIPTYAKGRLLDLGCGKVPFYELYKPFITENICVDWGNSVHKNQFLDFECDLNLKLPFQDSEFDTVVLSDVLEHIREPDLLLKEIYRVLKKDGNLIMNVPFFYWLHEIPFDYYRYTEFALENFAQKTGFAIIKIEKLGGAPEIIADILAKNIVGYRFFGKQLAIFVQNFTKWFINTKRGKFISKSSSANFPYGYFLVLKK